MPLDYTTAARRPKIITDVIDKQYNEASQINSYVPEGYCMIGNDGADNYDYPCGYSLLIDSKSILTQINQQKPNFSVLDIGCGNGKFLENIKKLYPQATVVGISACDMRSAEQKAIHTSLQIEYIVGNAEHLLTIPALANKKFDAIFSRYTFCHFKDPLLAVVQAYEFLANEGIFVTNHFTVPGLNKYLYSLSKYLNQNGYEFSATCSENFEIDFVEKCHYTGSAWYGFDCILLKKTKPHLVLPVSYANKDGKPVVNNYLYRDDRVYYSPDENLLLLHHSLFNQPKQLLLTTTIIEFFAESLKQYLLLNLSASFEVVKEFLLELLPQFLSINTKSSDIITAQESDSPTTSFTSDLPYNSTAKNSSDTNYLLKDTQKTTIIYEKLARSLDTLISSMPVMLMARMSESLLVAKTRSHSLLEELIDAQLLTSGVNSNEQKQMLIIALLIEIALEIKNSIFQNTLKNFKLESKRKSFPPADKLLSIMIKILEATPPRPLLTNIVTPPKDRPQSDFITDNQLNEIITSFIKQHPDFSSKQYSFECEYVKYGKDQPKIQIKLIDSAGHPKHEHILRLNKAIEQAFANINRMSFITRLRDDAILITSSKPITDILCRFLKQIGIMPKDLELSIPPLAEDSARDSEVYIPG